MTVLTNFYTDLKGVAVNGDCNKSTFTLFLVHLFLQTESWNVVYYIAVHLVNDAKSKV